MALQSIAGTPFDGTDIRASLHRYSTIFTTVKLRVGVHRQQLLCVDFVSDPSHEVLSAKLSECDTPIDWHDALMLSDDGKGGLAHCKEMIRLARRACKPVFFDPKTGDHLKFAGVIGTTHNRSEPALVVRDWW